ncbi:helix-turn-helix domain-containing protein [Sporosarcina thermotolerans]|uniref:Helix-turn-helix domain-containing protein n=1 Tax=Sporosarcina thermotolerans TaxID=633404 RepID=A0AAW9ABE8_9BACL|nr:TetR/AcrR family transcriptional regulator [Sporosarcina thermotolerans]MDW0116931.1 helix-turn-helix domain-containing protein [Sporosarcina thermotolerans]WHT47952.1 helix-turn-helix domain-containing protein [Sporosarcina thermotolerans]
MTEQNKHLLEEMLQEDESLTEKQKQILVAATEMFAEKGFAATSTNEIAKKAGVAEGTIFRHYKTKKELLLSIVTPMMVKMLAPFIIKDLNKVLDKEFEHFEDFLRAMIKNRQEFLEKNLKVVQIFLQEIPFHYELREQFIEHVGKKVLGRFTQIVEHYQIKGQITNMPPTTVIRLTASTIMGYFVTKHVIGANWNDVEEINQMITFLMKGLTAEN